MAYIHCGQQLVISEIEMDAIIKRVAAIAATLIFFVLEVAAGNTLALLNSANDRVVLWNPNVHKIVRVLNICEKQASVSDIRSVRGRKLALVFHRAGFNRDANWLQVIDANGKKTKTIPVSQSPFLAIPFGTSTVLVNHTFMAARDGYFRGEVVNLNTGKKIREFSLSGIPTNVVSWRKRRYIVCEDVTGHQKGVLLKSTGSYPDILLKNKAITSNIVSLKGRLFCGVNHNGAPKFRDSVYEIFPERDRVKLLAKTQEWPFLAGGTGKQLIVLYTNHMVRGNTSGLSLISIKTGRVQTFRTSLGPEAALVTGDRIFVACVCGAVVNEINLKTGKTRNDRLSDADVGFRSIVPLN